MKLRERERNGGDSVGRSGQTSKKLLAE